MRTMIGVLLVCQLAVPVSLFADEPKRPAAEAGTLMASGAREVARLVQATDSRRTAPPQEQQASTRGWIGRHPVLFGALVGAGAGVATGALMENELICSGGDEDCLIYGGARLGIGALMGAGVGALVGLAVGAAQK